MKTIECIFVFSVEKDHETGEVFVRLRTLRRKFIDIRFSEPSHLYCFIVDLYSFLGCFHQGEVGTIRVRAVLDENDNVVMFMDKLEDNKVFKITSPYKPYLPIGVQIE